MPVRRAPSILFLFIANSLLGLAALSDSAFAQAVEADVAVRVDDLQFLEVSVQSINDFVFKIEGEVPRQRVRRA